MNDLLGIQIRESCKLALPNGLKELMEDISREVLRAQPENLYGFITEYLAAMLDARDNLGIAVQVCEEICNSTCHPELKEELEDIGLDEQLIAGIEHIVKEYFMNGCVNEKNLLMVLSKKLNLESEMLPAVQEAVRSAYRRHFLDNAANSGLSQYENMFVPNVQDSSSTKAAKNTVKFHHSIEDEFEETTKHRFSVTSTSSISLAGSFLELPMYVPYSATECTLSSLTEHPETECCNLNCNTPGEDKHNATEEEIHTGCVALKNGETECEACSSKCLNEG